MSDIRTSLILDLTGNVSNRSRRYGRDLEQMSTRGSRAVHRLSRGLGAMGRGLDRLGSRYTAFLFGAGGVGTIRMVGNLEARFTRLGIQANKSAEEMSKLKHRIFEVSQTPDIRIDPSQLIGAIEQIVEKTGDLDFARANLRNLATAIQATGAQGSAIGGIAAEFQKMGLIKPTEVLKALDILDVQGKKGAFTLQNLAALGPRVVTAYTAMGRTGLPAIREMGAALQVIRQGTGGPEQAATAFEALMRVLSDADKVKALKQGGIKVFDPEELKKGREILRPVNELIVEIVKRAKGRGTVLDKVLGDAEALRAFKSVLTEFQATGKITSLDKYYKVHADGSTVLKDSARAAKDFNAALTNMGTTYQKFANKELSGPVGFMADKINSLSPKASDRSMQIAKWVGAIGGGAILGRMAYLRGLKMLGKHRRPGIGSKAPNIPGIGGVVPVYVVNKHMSLLNNGTGFAAGTATTATTGTAAAGGTSALLSSGAAMLPVTSAAAIAAISRETGKTIAKGQIGMATTERLKEMLGRQMVMGAGPNSYSYQQIQAELDRREMSGELKITIDHQNKLRVSRLESKNLHIDVDVGRTMVMP